MSQLTSRTVSAHGVEIPLLLGPKKTRMPYVRLGKSGIKVSRIILGCMSYGSPEWQPWVLGEEEGLEHIKAAYDAGIQTFDTANIYSNGLSEVILGKAIKKYNFPREEIVIMTKLWGIVGRTPKERLYAGMVNHEEYGYVNQMGTSRKHVFDAVKNSLQRLQLDYIDVLQCHRFDPTTPIEETMQALHDVVKAGYVRYIGMSSCYAWQCEHYSSLGEEISLMMIILVHAMQNYAITHKLTPFISMQNHYSLVYREEEREMMPTLKHFGVGSIPWSPLARGFLCRPAGEQTKRGDTDILIAGYGRTEGNKEIVKRVEETAKKRGYTMAQIACAWVMSKDPVAAPIIGTTNLKNLQELIESVHIKLTDEDINYLEQPYQPMQVFGHF